MAEVRKIKLEIVTPSGIALAETVDEFTAPSVEGEFGVLPGHRPLMASLKTGIVSFHKGNVETRVAVGSGFVEVFEDRAVVLTDRVATKEQVDVVRVRLDLKEVTEELMRYPGEAGDTEYCALAARQMWDAAQLDLYGDPPPATLGFVGLEAAPVDRYREGKGTVGKGDEPTD